MMSSIQSVAGQPVGPPLSKPDAPRRPAVGHDLVGQREQLVPRRRDLVAGGVEVVLRVPDHALQVRVGGEPVVLALELAERHEVLAEGRLERRRCRSPGPRARWRCPTAACAGTAPGCGSRMMSRVPRLGPDLELLLELAGGLDLGLVVDVRVDEVVIDSRLEASPPSGASAFRTLTVPVFSSGGAGVPPVSPPPPSSSLVHAAAISTSAANGTMSLSGCIALPPFSRRHSSPMYVIRGQLGPGSAAHADPPGFASVKRAEGNRSRPAPAGTSGRSPSGSAPGSRSRRGPGRSASRSPAAHSKLSSSDQTR